MGISQQRRVIILTKSDGVMDDLKSKDLESHLSNQFYVTLMDDEGNQMIPSYFMNKFSDGGGDTVTVQTYVIDNIDFLSIYKRLADGGDENFLRVEFLNSKGETDFYIDYTGLDLKEFYFDDLEWDNDGDDSALNFHLEYRYDDKELLYERSE